ncbi:MAG: ATP-binding protein [Bacteroidetes bacterium]|jgi:signal transduction histidine kinase/ligand-binding sensor domain-containing protein|nr:ATP-binding protein [Bacteroidota bacterium]
MLISQAFIQIFSKRLLILLLTIGLTALYAQPNYRFEHISKNDGLSQGAINAIFEDNNGLMWFGTKDGLNRYDGNEIKIYRRHFEDPLSLPNNHILAINQDKAGRLWIGTSGNDLCYLDPVTEKFYPFQNLVNENDSKDIGEHIYCIDIDHQNNRLLAGSNKGVLIINLDSRAMSFLDMQQFKIDSITVGNIYSLLSDGANFWIGTDRGGLLYYNAENEKITPIDFDHKRTNVAAAINRGTIFSIIRDKAGNIWIATYGDHVLKLDPNKDLLSRPEFESYDADLRQQAYTRQIALVGDTAIWDTTEDGFQVFDLKRETLLTVPHNPGNPSGVSSSSLKSIYSDSNGGVWIGGNGYGVNYYFPINKGFNHLRFQPNHNKSLTFKSIRSIYTDDLDNLYVGGYGGMNAFDKNGNRKWTNSQLQVAYVMSPDMQNEHLLWVGSEGEGLVLLNNKNGKIIQDLTKYKQKEAHKISGFMIMSLLPKSKNELWVGTETGLNLFNTDTYKAIYFQHDPDNEMSIPAGRIRDIFKDSKGRTWLASIGGGLAYMKDDDMLFRKFKNDPRDPLSLSSNNVYCVHESLSGTIYIGTESGLNRFDETSQTFSNLNTSNGLINDVVYRIESDSLGRLWISTNEGLSCYNPEKNIFRNYDREDGLQENEFNSGASYMDENGTMYFGGINGVTFFNPLSLKDNTQPPKVIFTNLTVGNEKAIIDPPIAQAKEVQLNYDNQAFMLEFAALNYYKPRKNQYAYRIREISDEWQSLGNTNSIEIVRLGFGTFTIEVMASNNDGYWNTEPAKLIISIAPPFWASNWFIAVLGLITILFFYAIYLLRIRSLKNKKITLEKEIKIRTKELLSSNISLEKEVAIRKKTEEELQEANSTKDKFFSIIAHDLKNPFNVLLGLSEILDQEYDQLDYDEKKEIISALRVSTDDLYKLLENLLSWSRTQQGKLKMNPQTINLAELVSENIDLLRQQATVKNIQIVPLVNQELETTADYNAITTVIRNLLSNAIKFTHQGGTITIRTETANDQAKISVEDNGIGIAKENQAKLFRIDEQFKLPGTMLEKGTGLGLILCREFAEANSGTLTLSSTLGEGSIFSLTLPLANKL